MSDDTKYKVNWGGGGEIRLTNPKMLPPPLMQNSECVCVVTCMSVACLSHVCRISVACLSHVCHMSVTCVSHVCHMQEEDMFKGAVYADESSQLPSGSVVRSIEVSLFA